MSLILDALNKNEREQQASQNAIPDINTQHQMPEQEPAKFIPLWVLLSGAGLALVIIILLLVLLIGRGSENKGAQEQLLGETSNPTMPTPSGVEPSASGKPSASGEPSARGEPSANKKPIADKKDASTFKQGEPGIATSPAKENMEAMPGAVESDADVQALYQPQIDSEPTVIVEPEIRPAIVQPSKPQNNIDQAQAQAIWDELNRLNKTPDFEQEAQVIQPQPVKAEEPEIIIEKIPDSLTADQQLQHFANTPFLHELPESFQNTIPSLMYNAHQFDQRYVVINKKRYTQGQQVATGVKLENLLYDGVILSYKNKSFKLSALSSWVNF